MAEAILYGVVVQLLNNLRSRALNEIASAWCFKDGLEELKTTINTIQYVLLDAEEKQAATDGRAVHDELEKLAIVVYAADDLFEEFHTIALRKQHFVGNKVMKDVRTFFSTSNQIAFAFKISWKIKSIKGKLKILTKNGLDFGLAQRALQQRNTIKPKRDQPYSSVEAEEVIGRDADKSAILDLLLASSSSDGEHEQRMLPVISIVGIGGMGKTTLAQLIYNEPLVQKSFELRLWVCVSDTFDVRERTEKTIKSAINSEVQNLEMEQLQGCLRKEIGDKKYLLVLDEVWNEDREKWLGLRGLLNVGRTGSKIIVTTRSSKVAKITSTFPPHELQGLSKEKSWDLFEKLAFEPGQAEKFPSLVQIGKEIAQKCANVPLAIRTLGSMLYGKDESKWLSLKNTPLANIDDNEHGIMNILKLSYHDLQSTLKSCFAYCALFPKDHNFNNNNNNNKTRALIPIEWGRLHEPMIYSHESCT